MAERQTGITVLVSDASLMICRLLADGLRRSHFELTGCITTSEELVHSVQQRRPDVVIISSNLQDGRLKGFQALHDVHSMDPAIRCVMLLEEHDRELVISAFRAGAKAVVFRDDSFSTLCKCIRALNEGQVWASSTDLQLVLEALSSAAPIRPRQVGAPRSLTRREQEIAHLVQQGLTNREIAYKLCVSEHTVKNHLFRVFEKLGVSNRVELVLLFRPGQERVA